MKLKSPIQKGKAFEREIAKSLQKLFDVKVMRTPCSGGIHDFVTSDLMIMGKSILKDLHIECKKRESLNCMETYDTTKAKAPSNKKTTVIWSKNHRAEPVVVIGYQDFCNILYELDGYRKENPE